MLVVGLTGGIGSGKSTVAQLFAAKGATIIDADLLARELTQPGTPALKKIIELFGSSILLDSGALDRTQLRKIIFADQEKRIQLEKILHPLIREAMQQQIASSKSPYCIVVIPLLFETESNPLIKRVLVVDAPEELQIARTTARDNATQNDVTAIVKTQVDRAKRLALADDIIQNDGSIEDLRLKVDKLHKMYIQLGTP